MWHSFQDAQLRASRTFVAALAVNQNDPETALQLMTGEGIYTSMRHINLMAWAQTAQFKDIFAMLNKMIEFFNQKNGKVSMTTSIGVVGFQFT